VPGEAGLQPKSRMGMGSGDRWLSVWCRRKRLSVGCGERDRICR
jgi:hypothetical protein